MPPHPPTRSGRRVVAGTFVALAIAVLGTACADDGGGDGGFGTAREVVDRHVELSAAYDLVADCELRHPDFVAEMAAIDGRESDGYCEWALQGVLANATPDERDATKSKYTDPTVTAGPEEGDEATFTLEAADGSYHEDIVVVEVDGRWYLRSADGTDDEHDHDH